jgi:hypothetical protein
VVWLYVCVRGGGIIYKMHGELANC